MSISGIGSGPVEPVTNQVVTQPVTKVTPTTPVQVAATSGNSSQQPQSAAPSQSTPQTGGQPLNARGRGQIVNLLV